MRRLFLTAAVLLSCAVAGAQDGTVTYALPRTCITLEVEAVKETFFAGPYAKFSEKYLGVEARLEDGTSYQLQSVKMVPCVEADPSVVLSAALPKGGVPDSFFSLTSQGLISIPAAASSKASENRAMRNPIPAKVLPPVFCGRPLQADPPDMRRSGFRGY